MEVVTSARFRREYRKLSARVKDVSEERFGWFLQDPFDPRLHTHKLIGALKGFYAFSLTNEHRVIFELESKDKARFYRVGTHDIYDV